MDLITFISHVGTLVVTSFLHNWPFLFLGVLTAAALKVYVGTDRVASLLRRRTDVAVAGSVAAAVATPFCSCGTTAVVISMLATAVPWAPIVAFMVASPLSSPDSLVYSAGLFGWPFAIYFFVASIFLGIAGGIVAHVAEQAGLLEGQARFAERAAAAGDGGSALETGLASDPAIASGPGCGCTPAVPSASRGLGPQALPNSRRSGSAGSCPDWGPRFGRPHLEWSRCTSASRRSVTRPSS